MNEYKKIIFNTILKFVGSANIIGNPVNLVGEISEGFKDLVNKP